METADVLSHTQEKIPDAHSSGPIDVGGQGNFEKFSPSSASGINSQAKSLTIPQISVENAGESQTKNSARSAFARLSSGLGLRLPAATPVAARDAPSDTATGRAGVFESLTKGLVDSSRSAVKAVQVKARHMVSQNKRRYQEGGFDLDLTYITDNIIAMGFLLGFYRNHMEEVIRFLEARHQGKYKVYNLCSERLYDASLFQGKAASFPFEDHNCPPIHLISSFCHSAYTWLKADLENVVVVHCKAGLGRTGLMISSLLLYLKFCPTAEESIDLFNQRRCIDGKGLTHPSQIRYVKYFERILNDNSGDKPRRRCMLRGFRLFKCPYWIRPSITISDHSGNIHQLP
ncbi:Phosphatidylinositol 3 4 5-trisphosphate 3-phosphatase and protein-tyrosine-phosphatase PTEN2A [Bienertia sinuspersici]